MIDTLKLRLDNVSFKRHCDLELKSGTINLRSGESTSPQHFLFKAGDAVVTGSGAFNNNERFNLDVSPRRMEPSIVDTTVHFSVAGVAHDGNNFYTASKDDTAEVLCELQDWLKEIGVSADVLDAFISRTDLFKNVQTSNDFRDYQPLFAAMTPARLEPHDYGVGFLWENGAHQICAYSKLEEMAIKSKKKKKEFDASQYPENTQRFEWRLFGQKVKNALEMQRAGNILDGYDSLETAYRASMKKQLFKRPVKEARQIIAVAEAEAGLKYFLDAGEKFWFEKWWNALPFTMVKASDLDAVVEAVERVAPNRMMPSRVREKLRGYKVDAVAIQQTRGNKTMSDLYQELEEKVLS